MKNIRKYILLLILSGTVLTTSFSIPAITKANLLPSNNITQNITNTEDLPILQSPIARNVYDVAKSITVMIRVGDKVGSGVIIAKNGEKYYLLTASHVFQGLLEAEITTPDGKVYPIKINEREARIGETDLGVLEFSSKENYQVATLANSRLKDMDIAFTYGFPRENVIKGNNRGLFSIGYTLSQEGSMTQASNANVFFNQGYELAYSNLTAVGVSGGPVLDSQGRLVGIHGQADGYNELDETGKQTEVYLGYSIGIPIGYLFGDLVKDKNWKTYLQQDKDNATVLSTDIKNELLETVVQSLKVPTDNNAFAWLNYANQLWRYREYHLAIDTFEKAISLKSDLYYAYYGKGLALYYSGEYQEAIAILETGINIYNQTGATDKKFIIACLDWQGRSLQSLEKYEEALKLYEQAIQLDTDEKDRNFVLYFQKGLLLSKLKRYEQVIFAYSEAIKIKPNYSWDYYNRGNTYYELKKYDKAISDYSQAISLAPQYAQAYNNRGLTYSELKEYDKALSDLNQAISLDPQLAQVYSNRGLTYYELKKYDKALSDLNQAISLDPQLAQAYYNRSLTYSELKEYDKELNDLNQAISLDPQLAQAYYNRGNIYSELKKYDKATSDYSQAISLNPQDAQAYNNRGLTYSELKEYDKAISDYSQAISLAPQDAQAYTNRGITYAILGDKQKAINDIEKAKTIFCQQGSPSCEEAKELLQQLKQ